MAGIDMKFLTSSIFLILANTKKVHNQIISAQFTQSALFT